MAERQVTVSLTTAPGSHAGPRRAPSSEEEAELVIAEIHRLLGLTWVDQHGETKPLGPDDVLVVAPYNDQVDVLRARLDSDPATAGVAVGTVDKFQGREAAGIFLTMATSSAADMNKSADFLFSKQRFICRDQQGQVPGLPRLH